MASDEMVAFLEITRDRYELALQQNEVVNLFEDPYKDGDGEGLDFAEKTDEEISETQNFQAKNTSVMAISFQPGRKGIVGMCGREQVHILPNSRYPARTHSHSLIVYRMYAGLPR